MKKKVILSAIISIVLGIGEEEFHKVVTRSFFLIPDDLRKNVDLFLREVSEESRVMIWQALRTRNSGNLTLDILFGGPNGLIIYGRNIGFHLESTQNTDKQMISQLADARREARKEIFLCVFGPKYLDRWEI